MTRSPDLDAVLRSWMAGGAERAPERALEDALSQVDRTSQRRPPPLTAPRRLNGPSTDHRVLAFSLAVVLVAVLLVSTGIRVGLIEPPDLNPAPDVPGPSVGPVDDSPGPQPTTADGFVTFAAPDGSFRVRLPDSWHEATGPDPAALYVRSGQLDLSIRAADVSGTIRTCDEPAGPWEECLTVQPRTLDALSAAVGLTSTPEEGVGPPLGPRYASMTLGGEPASVVSLEAYEFPARGAEFVKYVVAMHGGRAYVARFWTPVASGIPDATDLLAGFEFVSAASEPVPTSQRFVAPDGSFAIRLPASWHEATGPDPAALYLTSPLEKLSISLRGGDSDGRVRTCDEAAAAWEVCSTVTAETLEELEDGIRLNDDFPTPLYGPTAMGATLDGVPARSVAMVGPGGSTGSIGVRYVVAMRDGRPFVIRGEGRAPIEPALGLMPLLDGFEFIAAEPDPTAVATPTVDSEGAFVSPDGTFALRLPDEWMLNTGPDPSALYLGNPTTGLEISIRGGDPNGQVLTCDTGVSGWETCASVRPRTLEELAASIGLDAEWPTAFVGPNESTVRLAGVEATSISMVASNASGGGSIPTGVRYVVAMHEGRPFVVRATESRPLDANLGLMDVLDGFEFR